jgi:hypothetical protein
MVERPHIVLDLVQPGSADQRTGHLRQPHDTAPDRRRDTGQVT